MSGIEVIAERDAHTLLIGVVVLSRLTDGIVSDVLSFRRAENVVSIECTRETFLEERLLHTGIPSF